MLGKRHTKASPEMRIGAAVRQARVAAGMTQVELAEKAGIAQQTLSNLERGVTHRTSYLHEISQALGTSVEEMLAGLPEHVLRSLGEGLRAAYSIRTYGKHEDRTLPAWFLFEIEKAAEQVMLYKMRDDSMAPRIRSGDYLLIDTHDTAVQSGLVYAIEVGGSLLVRRAEQRVAGGLRLSADAGKSPPEDIAADQAPLLKVLGRVFWTSGLV